MHADDHTVLLIAGFVVFVTVLVVVDFFFVAR